MSADTCLGALQLFGIATIFFALRLYSRLHNKGVTIQMDDWVLLAGWIFVLAASACMSWLMVIFIVPDSLEKITAARIHHNLQSLALALTKTSFGITLLRLLSGPWETRIIWAVIVSMNFQFAVHMIATWQAICGAQDQGHIGGDNCWELEQSVTFTVFSAVYSALCDFILALLPWKMIFSLQMKRSERISIALALSMGILAGVTGVMKAYHGYILIDVRSPDYFYNQAVYWIWSQAEPNVTIVSASIPVLRGFVRKVRGRPYKSSSSAYAANRSIQTGGGINTSSRAYKTRTVTASVVRGGDRANDLNADDASDSSILGLGPNAAEPGDGKNGGGIKCTTEFTVGYEPRPQSEDTATGKQAWTALSKDASFAGDEFEMDQIKRIDDEPRKGVGS